MNILIYGNMASGKTLIAELLAKHYRGKKQKVRIINDASTVTLSLTVGEVLWQKSILTLEKTLHKPAKHLIITTQATPNQILGFFDTEERDHQYDYYYHIWENDGRKT